ncbi:carboxymuconolactone decarboxylase family protein [Actinokineospora sp.]|uniref:carboxymuconolactone decarboxylase family protein n=1 Tax=Actinokineospora sp. TaxID=1872133 RepID=UPI004037DC50
MGGMLVRTAMRRTLDQIRHVTPVRPRRARDLVARVYRQAERDFGMLAPPVGLHSPAPESLAASWMLLRESLLARGLVDRAAKEIVAAAVSLGNTCPYCVEVHSATLGGLRGPGAAALAAADIGSITDPAARDLAAWARATGTRTGAAPPFPVEQTPEFVGVAVTFHYLNRMVNIFLDDSPLPPVMPAAMRGRARKVLGRVMRPSASRDHEPGTSLGMLPAAPAAPDLAWTTGNPTIAEGFTRAYAAIDAAGERSVPDAVRGLVAAELDGWDGLPVGLSRGWVADKVSALARADRPAATLALLTAMASYQVDQAVIDDFRRGAPADRSLVELTSWAALSAARRTAVGVLTEVHGPGSALDPPR